MQVQRELVVKSSCIYTTFVYSAVCDPTPTPDPAGVKLHKKIKFTRHNYMISTVLTKMRCVKIVAFVSFAYVCLLGCVENILNNTD